MGLWAVITTALSLAPMLCRAKARIELQRTHGHNEDQRCHIPYNQLTLQAVNTTTIPAGAFIMSTGHVKNPVSLETDLNLLDLLSISNNNQVHCDRTVEGSVIIKWKSDRKRP